MPKTIHPAHAHRLWLYGRSYMFHPVSLQEPAADGPDLVDVELGTEDFQLDSETQAPARYQKTQIVLHCTGGNNPIETVMHGWKTKQNADGTLASAAAHYLVEFPSATPVPRGASSGSNLQDSGMVDAVRVIDENAAVAHGGMVNEQSIGIEHANVGHGMGALDRRHVPHLTGTGTGQRPRDPNGWLSLPAARGLGAGPGTEGARYFQAYQDKQYRTMTLLLRHLWLIGNMNA